MKPEEQAKLDKISKWLHDNSLDIQTNEHRWTNIGWTHVAQIKYKGSAWLQVTNVPEQKGQMREVSYNSPTAFDRDPTSAYLKLADQLSGKYLLFDKYNEDREIQVPSF